MDEKLRQAFHSHAQKGPFASKFTMNVLKIVDGYSKVEMKFHPDMENLFGKAHGNPCGGAQDATADAEESEGLEGDGETRGQNSLPFSASLQ